MAEEEYRQFQLLPWQIEMRNIELKEPSNLLYSNSWPKKELTFQIIKPFSLSFSLIINAFSLQNLVFLSEKVPLTLIGVLSEITLAMISKMILVAKLSPPHTLYLDKSRKEPCKAGLQLVGRVRERTKKPTSFIFLIAVRDGVVYFCHVWELLGGGSSFGHKCWAGRWGRKQMNDDSWNVTCGVWTWLIDHFMFASSSTGVSTVTGGG